MKKICLIILMVISFMFNAYGLELYSNDVSKQGTFDDKYSYGHDNISPQLYWDKIPVGTKSLAIIMDDPDALTGTWTHWILYSILPNIYELPQKISFVFSEENFIKRGMNDYNQIMYCGPWPPEGQTHTYNITLYALDTMIQAENGLNRKELDTFMKGHILEQVTLKVKYSR